MGNRSTLKISIITVCYNAGKTIEKTIKSVVGQTFPNIEYIVVDGKSEDHTLDVVNAYASRITQIISEPDRGIYDAMNKGIRISTGDFLLFLNADDYLVDDETISLIAERLADDRRTDILFGNVMIYDQKTGHGRIWQPKKLCNALLYRTTLPHQAVFFKRRVFDTIGFYNDGLTIAADYDILVKAYKKRYTFRRTRCIVSVFTRGGISNNEKNAAILKKERQDILKSHFSVFERIYLRIRVRFQKIFNV